MYPLHQRFQKHFFDDLVFTPIFPLSKSRFRCIQRVVVKDTKTVPVGWVERIPTKNRIYKLRTIGNKNLKLL